MIRARRQACLDEEPRLSPRLPPLQPDTAPATLVHVGGVSQHGEARVGLGAASRANLEGCDKVS